MLRYTCTSSKAAVVKPQIALGGCLLKSHVIMQWISKIALFNSLSRFGKVLHHSCATGPWQRQSQLRRASVATLPGRLYIPWRNCIFLAWSEIRLHQVNTIFFVVLCFLYFVPSVSLWIKFLCQRNPHRWKQRLETRCSRSSVCRNVGVKLSAVNVTAPRFVQGDRRWHC